MINSTAVHVHHAFYYISLTSTPRLRRKPSNNFFFFHFSLPFPSFLSFFSICVCVSVCVLFLITINIIVNYYCPALNGIFANRVNETTVTCRMKFIEDCCCCCC